MDNREKQIMEVVGALANLERELGSSPSVADVAERSGYSNGTVHSYLREAAARGDIAQRQGRFMTLSVARAFDEAGTTGKGK